MLSTMYRKHVFSIFLKKIGLGALVLIAAIALVWAMSEVNNVELLYGSLAFISFFYFPLKIIVGGMALISLFISLRSKSIYFGYCLLSVSGTAALYVYQHIWQFPTTIVDFYILRDDLNDLIFVPPSHWQHVLAVMLLVFLTQLGLVLVICKRIYFSVVSFITLSGVGLLLLILIKTISLNTVK